MSDLMPGPRNAPVWPWSGLPSVVGHRGHPLQAPENTVASFEAAIAAGADIIELDVQLTADRVPVVIHDDRLDRTTKGSGLVRDHTLPQLRELASTDPGTAIPTLAEVLAWAVQQRVRLLVEPKTHPTLDPDAALHIAAVMAAAPEADAIVYSSDHVLITRLRQLLPDVPRGVILNEYLADVADVLERTGSNLLSQSMWVLTAETVALARDRGCLVSAEARCPADVAVLQSWGVPLVVSGKLEVDELVALVSRLHGGELC